MPGLGTWHGDVEFELLDGEELRSLIAQQPNSCLHSLFFYLITIAVALVCAGILVNFYVHSIIAVVGVAVLLRVLAPKQSDPKSTM